MSQTLTVDIWSDLICPWCWIGKRRLERALAGFPHREQVRLVHHAFRLMPGAPAAPARDTLVQKLGSPQRVAQMLGHVEGEAAKEGLEYHLADGWVGDTLDLHRLVKFAAAHGLSEQAVERFYRAGFTEVETVFDRQTQLRLIAEIGLDRGAAEAVLDGDAHAQAVAEDQQAAQSLGGSGVPFFRIGGRYLISGAQPQEVFAKALQQAWDEQPVLVAQGAVCGPDGCALPS